jgi:hypothetical protein
MEVVRIDREHVRARTGTSARPSADRTVSLPLPPDAALLAEELASFARDPVYPRALSAAALLVGARPTRAHKS